MEFLKHQQVIRLFTVMTVLLVSFNVAAAQNGELDLTDLANYANQPIPNYVPLQLLNSVPADNLQSDRGATLGRVLFYDKRLSSNNSVSCASCHDQSAAFGDTADASVGVAGTTGRHSMRLINSRFMDLNDDVRRFWDKRAMSLEDQATQPIRDHVEMGYSGTNGDPDFDDLLAELAVIPEYQVLFSFTFGDSTINEDRIQKAISQFIRSIQSFDSRFDEGIQLVNGNELTNFPNFTAAENRGKRIFTLPRGQGGVGCAGCHASPTFQMDSMNAPNGGGNNGVVTSLGGGTDFTNTRAPNLRDLVDANGIPHGGFMHDASKPTLQAVVAHYNRIPPGVPGLDQRLGGQQGQNLNLNGGQINDLVAFMETLTGSDVYTNEKWSDPFDANGDLVLVTAPEIAISNANSDLTSGDSVIDCGEVNVGASAASLTFTILNDGSEPLTGLSVGVSGDNSQDFEVGSLSQTTLDISESLTFTVTFTPVAPGERMAELEITSNDSDENPFSIELTGLGVAISPTEFEVIGNAATVGDVQQMVDSDDDKFEMYPRTTRVKNVELRVKSSTDILNPTSLAFTVESKPAIVAVFTQKIALKNYATGQYEQLDSRVLIPRRDNVVEVTGAGDLSRFVDQATGEVEASILFERRAISVNAVIPWDASVDQIYWSIDD